MLFEGKALTNALDFAQIQPLQLNIAHSAAVTEVTTALLDTLDSTFMQPTVLNERSGKVLGHGKTQVHKHVTFDFS